MHINEGRLWSMCRDSSETPFASILQVILEAVLRVQPDKVSDQGDL